MDDHHDGSADKQAICNIEDGPIEADSIYLKMQPIADGVEQAVRDSLIVDRLEEAKKTAAFLVTIVVGMVDDASNAANRLAVSFGQESLHIGMVVERMLLVSNQFFLIQPQRRNPIRIIPIELPRELQKSPLIPAAFDFNDFQIVLTHIP